MKTNLDTITPFDQGAKTKVSDEFYIINLCDKLLKNNKSDCSSFGWVLGDLSNNGKVNNNLPVAVFYENIDLVIEFKGKHSNTDSDSLESLLSNDYKNKDNIQGYNNRRKQMLEKKGINLVTINYYQFNTDLNNNLVRNQKQDILELKSILKQYIK